MARILSIEVGNTITRICEMDYKVKNPKVYCSVSINTPKGVLEDGFIKDNEEFSLSIKDALVRNNIKTKQVIFTITSNKIVTREVVLPAVGDKKIGDMVRANANDYFPIDLSLYEVSHVILGKVDGDDGSSKNRVMVMAAGKDLIQSYRNLSNRCGLRLSSLDYSGNSVYQIMKDELTDGTELIIKLEENSAIASVISNHNLVLQRHIANGFDRAVEALVNSSTFYENDYESAFKAMCSRACIRVSINAKTRVVEYGELKEDDNFADEYRNITNCFAQLVGNLTRVVELHNLKESQNPITRVTLIGLGADIVDLEKLLTNELGIKCSKLSNIRTAYWGAGYGSETVGRYVTAIGAGYDPVGFMGGGGSVVETSSKTKKMNFNYNKISVVIAIVGLAIAAGISVPPIITRNNEKQREEELKRLEVLYKEGEDLFHQFNAVKYLDVKVTNAYNKTENDNDKFVALLRRLETNLPSNLHVTLIDSTAETCKISIAVPMDDPLNEAAAIFQLLRNFKNEDGTNSLFQDVTVGEVERKGNDEFDAEAGVRYFQFTAVCHYFAKEIKEVDPEVLADVKPDGVVQ